jgi:hypothetical protein
MAHDPRKALDTAFVDMIQALQFAHADSKQAIFLSDLSHGELHENQRVIEPMTANIALSFAKLVKALSEAGCKDFVDLRVIVDPLFDGISDARDGLWMATEDMALSEMRERRAA